MNPMTTPRDALRVLHIELTEAEMPEKAGGNASIWADAFSHVARRLAAIVSQMDSEPTVAQWRDGQRVEWTNHLGHTFAGTIEHRFPAVRFDDGVFRVFADNEFDQLRSLAAKARQL